MPSTAKGYPYPASTDTPDVPRDVKALADKVEALVPRIATGTAQVPANAAAASSTVAITFPAGEFTAPPVVVGTMQAATGGLIKCSVRIAAVSATGATVYLSNTDGTVNVAGGPVAWIAMQP